MTTQTQTPSIENILDNVADLMAKIGDRKFTNEDMFGAAEELAEMYTLAYTGDFSYMTDMQANLKRWGNLSLAQARGVLNCARAEVNRQTRQAAEALVAESSEWVGSIKDRITIEATITFAKEFDGHYGTTTLVGFVDAEGNVFKWFASSYPFKVRANGYHQAARWQKWNYIDTNDAIGQSVTLTGTIKDHTVYNGVKETMLTRCAIDGLVAPEVEMEEDPYRDQDEIAEYDPFARYNNLYT